MVTAREQLFSICVVWKIFSEEVAFQAENWKKSEPVIQRSAWGAFQPEGTAGAEAPGVKEFSELQE